MFQVTYNLGSFIWGLLSEYFGRVSILFVGTAIFATFNLACGLSQTPAQMLIFRFLAGIGGATPFAVRPDLLCSPQINDVPRHEISDALPGWIRNDQ